MNVLLDLAQRELRSGRGLRTLGTLLMALVVGRDAVASTGISAPVPQGQIAASFDPVAQETRVREKVSADLCVSFRLARQWTLKQDKDATLQAIASLRAPSGDDLEIRLRPAAELQTFPQADLPARDAAALQGSYEELLGKPAQSVIHQPAGPPGVSRWSATWVDQNLAGPSHALTIETFIVDLRGGGALELTMNVGDSAAYRQEISRLLASLQVTSGVDCRDRPVAER
jgi:hypothetical protein